MQWNVSCPSYDAHKLIKLSGNPDNNPMMQAEPCLSSNGPRLAQVESRVNPLFDFVFSWGGGGSQREGCTNPDAGISPCANRMGKYDYQAHFDGKYTSENIYPRCQSSITCMVVVLHVNDIDTAPSLLPLALPSATHHTLRFLPKASFGLRVLSSPASVGLCVRVCVSITSLSAR